MTAYIIVRTHFLFLIYGKSYILLYTSKIWMHEKLWNRTNHIVCLGPNSFQHLLWIFELYRVYTTEPDFILSLKATSARELILFLLATVQMPPSRLFLHSKHFWQVVNPSIFHSSLLFMMAYIFMADFIYNKEISWPLVPNFLFYCMTTFLSPKKF